MWGWCDTGSATFWVGLCLCCGVLAVGFAVWMVLRCSLLCGVWFVGDFLDGYYLGLGFVVG